LRREVAFVECDCECPKGGENRRSLINWPCVEASPQPYSARVRVGSAPCAARWRSLADEDEGSPEQRRRLDRRAERDLEKLADRYANFCFVRLGGTHAKVLLSDKFVVTTSFNWLSFRGDPHGTFRDEQGMLVSVPEMVDERFDRNVSRLS